MDQLLFRAVLGRQIDRGDRRRRQELGRLIPRLDAQVSAHGPVHHHQAGDLAIQGIACDVGRGEVHPAEQVLIDVRFIFPHVQDHRLQPAVGHRGLEGLGVMNGPP